MKSFLIIFAMFVTVVSAYSQESAQQDGVSHIPGSNARAAGFGPANFRQNLGTNGPGRAANLPAAGGSLNENSAFPVTTSPFGKNSVAGTVGPLPPSGFSPNVATPAPPGVMLDQQSPTYYPVYVPDGSMNQYAGPGTRGHIGNAYAAGAETTPTNSVPSIAMTGYAPAPLPTSATPTYTYEVPPYYGP